MPLAGLTVAATFGPLSTDYHWLVEDDTFMLFEFPDVAYLAVISYVTVTFGILALWRLRSAKPLFLPEETGRRRAASRLSRGAHWALMSFAILVACPLSYLYWIMSIHLPIPPQPNIDPNGYDRLMKISKRFDAVDVPREAYDSSLFGEEERWDEELGESVPVTQAYRDAHLKKFVSEHPDLLDEVQEALKLPSFVPVNYTDFEKPTVSFDLFSLANSLQAIGRHAEQHGKVSHAIDAYLTVIRVGHVAAGDGLWIDHMLGTGCEEKGMKPLRAMRHDLTVERRRKLLEQLLGYEGAIGPLDECDKRDEIWATNSYDCRMRFVRIAYQWNDKFQSWVQGIKDTADEHDASNRLLTTTLALDIYGDEHGDLPETLNELVPELLPKLPEDPFGPGPLLYRRLNAEKYVLYSRGRNRVDDGGVVIKKTNDGESEAIKAIKNAIGLDYHNNLDHDKSDFFLDQTDWSSEEVGDDTPTDEENADQDE